MALSFRDLCKQCQPNADDPDFLAKPETACFKTPFDLRISAAFSGSFPKARPNAGSHFLGMILVEEIDQRTCYALRLAELPVPAERLTANQKSSRTMTTHCTRPPSHWRKLCTSSAFGPIPSWSATIARNGR